MTFDLFFGLTSLTAARGQANASGITRLRLVRADAVRLEPPTRWLQAGAPAPVGHTVGAGALTLLRTDAPPRTNEAGVVIDVEVMPEYASFTEEPLADANGAYFRPSVQLVLPRTRTEVIAWVQHFGRVEWLALVQDRNGLVRVAGTPEQPLGVSMSQATGTGFAGRNQTVWTFTGLVEQPAYLTASLDTLFAPGPAARLQSFSSGFSNGFR